MAVKRNKTKRVTKKRSVSKKQVKNPKELTGSTLYSASKSKNSKKKSSRNQHSQNIIGRFKNKKQNCVFRVPDFVFINYNKFPSKIVLNTIIHMCLARSLVPESPEGLHAHAESNRLITLQTVRNIELEI